MAYQTNMDNLPDELLVEIWSRVPYKMAVRCKSIFKRFSALISRPEFMSRSIYHHHTLFQHMKEEELEKEWYFNVFSKGKLFIMFLPNLHLPNHPNQLSLSFLGRKFDPKFDDFIRKNIHNMRIVGCSNGLILCKIESRERVYIVCNPITRDWVILPLLPPPLTGHNQQEGVVEGFVCEPYYHVEGDKVTFNRHRFRVVRFPSSGGTWNEIISEFEVVVFSSEDGRWSRMLVSCPPKGWTQSFVLPRAVAHEGKLHFMGKMGLLVYDPFNNDGQCQCDIISYPNNTRPYDILSNGHVGVCCGNIRIACVYNSSFADIPEKVKVCVWKLEQDSQWRLLHVTFLPTHYFLRSIRRVGGEISDLGMTRVRAFHRHHGDVMFFQRANSLFCGNLKTNHFETVGQLQELRWCQIISLDLPWWPTPVPSKT